MIRSMTGYGEAERDTEAGRLRVEIRTVNHRFLNGQIKTPHGMDRYEGEILQWLRPFLARGHARVTVTLERPGGGAPPVEVDVERARQYQQALNRLRDELGIQGPVDLPLLARFGEIFRAPDPETATRPEVPSELLQSAVEEAARGVVSMREAEGGRLQADLQERLAALDALLDQVAARAPVRLIAERDRLREAIRILSEGVGVDEDRLAREVAHMAERWDVAEEIVRFRAHNEAFGEAMAGSGEPAGKRLGFLVQEMNREANTIGSKANDAILSHLALSLKEEVERVREQLENIE
jgi:uncharacterized protein (TIGR00255 family)